MAEEREMPIRLVIADDHEVVRIGLRTLLGGDEFHIVGEAASGDAALKLVKKHRPDILLLDVRMPNGDGLECLARVKLDHANIPVLMLSAFDNPTYLARALALGASGYLSKSASANEIVDAIKAAAQGQSVWTEDEIRRVSGALVPPLHGSEMDIFLTRRESEVLKQLSFGLTNKEIGQLLGISYETVKEHVQHVLRKIGVTDRTQAAVWAVRKNLS